MPLKGTFISESKPNVLTHKFKSYANINFLYSCCQLSSQFRQWWTNERWCYRSDDHLQITSNRSHRKNFSFTFRLRAAATGLCGWAIVDCLWLVLIIDWNYRILIRQSATHCKRIIRHASGGNSYSTRLKCKNVRKAWAAINPIWVTTTYSFLERLLTHLRDR